MKRIILHGCITIGKFLMNLLYFFMKLAPQRRKVVFLSRQSDMVPLDFRLLQEELETRESPPELVMLCQKIGGGLRGKLGYVLYLLRAMAQLSTAKVAVVDTYCIPVSVLKQRKSLTVLQIWHALGAVKKFGKQILGKGEGSSAELAEWMNMHRNYTRVYTASAVTKQFYAEAFGVPESILTVRGMPRVDFIQLPDEQKKSEFFNLYRNENKKPIILYLPTFRKGAHLDIKHLVEEINHDRFRLIIKLHPLDQEPVDSRFLVDDRFSSYDLMKIADFIITDYSAISIEASLLQKPVYFYVYDILEYQDSRGLNINLYEEMAASISTKAREIALKIEQEPYDYEALLRFRDRYVETWAQNNTAQIADDIIEACNRAGK